MSTKKFSFGTTTVRVQPGKEKEVKYTVSPANAGLQWMQNDDSYVTYQDMGNDTGSITENNGDDTALITVTPKTEGQDSITVTATNPSTKEQYASKTIALDFEYETLSFTTKVISKTGNFSRLDGDLGVLNLGDGETMQLAFSVKEDKAEYNIQSVAVEKVGSNSEPVSVSATSETLGNGTFVYNLMHGTDYIQTSWIVDRDCYYTVDGAKVDINAVGWNKNTHPDNYTGTSWGSRGYWHVNGHPYIRRSGAAEVTTSLGKFYGVDVKLSYDMFDSPRFYTDAEFKKNQNWYAPAWVSWHHGPSWSSDNNWFSRSYGEYIINSWAKKGNVTSTALVSRKQTHNLLVTYNHAGKTKTMKVPVYTERRDCPKTQQ